MKFNVEYKEWLRGTEVIDGFRVEDSTLFDRGGMTLRDIHYLYSGFNMYRACISVHIPGKGWRRNELLGIHFLNREDAIETAQRFLSIWESDGLESAKKDIRKFVLQFPVNRNKKDWLKDELEKREKIRQERAKAYYGR